MRVLGCVAVALGVGCTPVPPAPVSLAARTPTPGSVTRENPGGDALSPEDAALERLLAKPGGMRTDRAATLVVALPDAERWRRVRFLGYPTRAGFRYGDDHHAVAVVIYEDAGGDDDPFACVERFARRASRIARLFDLELDPLERELHQHDRGVEAGALLLAARNATVAHEPADMPVVRTRARFVTLLDRDRYVAAVAAYRSWPGSCLLQGFAARAGGDEALASRVVDRWVRAFAPELRWRVTLRGAPPLADR